MHIVLGLLAVVGLATAGIALLAWRATHGAMAGAFLVGGLVLALRALRAMWRRDSYGAAQFILFCAALPALVCGLWALNVRESAAPLTGATVFTLPVIACAAFLYRQHTRPELLPNVLKQWVGAGHISELGELQLAVQLVKTEIRGILYLKIAVQSCVDAERVLRVSLSGPPASRLRYRPQANVRVGPGEVGILSLPIAPVAGAGDPGKLHLDPDVSGDHGPRIRYWRAQPYQRRITGGFQAALLLAGHAAWGGGFSVNVPAPEAPGPPDLQLPPDVWMVSWTPDRGLLASARER